MSFNDNGADDWITPPSAPAPAPASGRITDGPDDWVVAPSAPVRAAAAPSIRATAPMPPAQGLDDWVAPVNQSVASPASNSVPAPKPEQTESAAGTPPVQALDDAPFRAPGSGMATNMLSGDEAYQARENNIAGAEAAVAAAQERLAQAELRQRQVTTTLVNRGTPGQQQRLYVDAEVDRARANLDEAQRSYAAASRSAPPTQTATRDAASRFATAVGTIVPDTAGGIMRPIDAALDAAGMTGGTGSAEWLRKQSGRIEQANQPDLTRNEEFTAKMGAGAGSAAGFVATGFIGRAAGAGAALTSGVTGAAQNAEQFYREADSMGLPAYRKAMAYVAGGAIGATEAAGLGRIADAMERTTAGGVKRYFGLVAKEMGEEGTQEAVQQLLENISKYGILDKDPGDITKDVAENALIGALLGMGMAGTMGLKGLATGRGAEAGMPPVPQPVPDPNAQVPPPGAPPGGPASAPSAPSAAAPGIIPATLSPIEQRLLIAAGITPDIAATMSRQQIDAVIERSGEAAGNAPAAPAPAAPVSDPLVDATMALIPQNAPSASTAPLDAAAQGNNVSHETTPGLPTAPLDTGPVPVQPAAPVQGLPLPPSNDTAKSDITPPGPNRLTLQAMLDDPRSAAEIRAEMEAARIWQPTADWQAVPQGATLDPTLEIQQLADGTQQARLAPTPGTRAAPVQLETPDDVHTGAELTANPTPAQAEAGNYRKRHVQWDGLDISVETEQGTARTGIGADGKPWSAVMPRPYGHILGTEGADGDPLDITLGPNPQAPSVFVVDQIDPDTGKFDEHKSFQGFDSADEARAAYEASFSDGTGDLRLGAISELPRPEFKAWTKSGNTTKPLAYQEPAPIAPRKRAASDRPLSLFEFLASQGGLKPAPEVRAIISGNPFIPGFGRLIRPSGRALDHAREGAVEAGYLRDTPFEGGLATSTIRDLLDAIDSESRGNKLYSENDLAKVAEREAAKSAQQDKALRREIAIDVREISQRIDITLSAEEVEQAVDLIQHHNYEIDEAIVDVAERHAMAADDDLVASEQETTDGDAATRTGSDGQEPAPAGQQSEGPFAGPAQQRPQGGEPSPRIEQAARPAEAAQAPAPAADLGDLAIPAFLRRDKNERIAPQPAAAQAEVAQNSQNDSQSESTPKARTPEAEIKAEADRRWREWVPSREHPTRPRLDTFVKIVRKERRIADRDAARAKAVADKEAAKDVVRAEARRQREEAKATQSASEPRKREFPSYTTQQLKDTLADGTKTRNMRPEVVERMRAEVAARESGESVERVTPQVGGRGAWQPIGKNAKGHTVYEDQRGVRSYVERGIRITETVQLHPTRDGIQISTGDRGKEFEVASAADKTSENLPAVRENLFVNIEGRKFPLTSYADASRAYRGAIDKTGATSSGRTGPQAPQPLITDDKGNVVAHISYNGKVWKGSPEERTNGPGQLLYDPDNGPDAAPDNPADWWENLNKSDRNQILFKAKAKASPDKSWDQIGAADKARVLEVRPEWDARAAQQEKEYQQRVAEHGAAEKKVDAETDRKDGESDEDYFLRLINDHYKRKGVEENVSFDFTRKKSEPLLGEHEHIDVPFTVKRFKGAITTQETPAGFTSGVDISTPSSGSYSGASIWPDRAADRGYFDTVQEARQQAVEDMREKLQSVAKNTSFSQAEQTNAKKAIEQLDQWANDKLAKRPQADKVDLKVNKEPAAPENRKIAITPELTLATALRDRILDATYKSAGNRWNARARISDIHAALPDVPLADLHAEMKAMQRNEEASLMQLDHRPDVTGADKESALRIGSDPRHLFWVSKDPRAKAPENRKIAITPELTLATALRDRIAAGKPLTTKILQDEAAAAYGSKLADGKFDRKDMADALELAVNMHIKETRHLRVDSPNPQHAIKMLTDLLDTLPTQRVRTEEMVKFQQFSTPPNYAAAAAYVANVRAGDTVLEPSAGTGSIVAAVSRPGATIIANELSDRRAALLRELVGTGGQVFTENAEQLDNILPDSVKPTVVVMNPPFSQTAGRMGDKKVLETAQVHIEQALNRLEPGGRLVAIVGQGMTLGAPKHRAWFQRIGATHAIRASIGVDGKVYEKYGTTFGTRLYVIDKVKPTGERPVTADVHSVDELMRALEPIRDGRPEIEQRADQSSGVEVAEADRGARAGAVSSPADAGGVGNGKRSAGGAERGSDEGLASAGRSGERAAQLEAGQPDVLAGEQSERPGSGRAGAKSAAAVADSGQSNAGSDARPQRDLQSPASGQSSAAASGERVVVESAAPGTQPKSELSESLYEHYEPRRAKVKGAKPHPGPLVESASMASVMPPPATYAPHLPKDVIDKGLLSTAQLEPVIYAGQAHGKMLPAADGETAKRRGFFIGDGTGVGKGREIAGVILDNWSQGRTKAIWVSEKKTLLEDAKRDWKGLGQNPNELFEAGKVKTGESITAAKGIGFITYDTLKGGMSDQAAIAKGGFVKKQEVSVNGATGTVQKVVPGRAKQPAEITIKLVDGSIVTAPANEVQAIGEVNVKSRVDQLVEWFGKDFDGVIAFDEAHNMGNASSTKGERGTKEAALKAIAGLELQARLPNARVVYVSATGATEVSNLAYADRLGLWGRGTPFASRETFISEVEQGGIAAMELIARDMKQLGLYTARNLSYDGVEYARIEHKLDANQREIYDTLAESWQVVLRNMNEALKLTGGDKDARAKSAAKSAFWGGHQRFFNQIVTSLQMPSVIKAVEADLKAGRQAVLQLTNTNEASQERAAAKAKTAEDIEDLDITPRDQIIQLVETSFPTQEYEAYVDENGKERSRPVTDSEGNPVENKQAVRMREALIDRLASVRVPQGPLDMVLDHFGIENVAEITGRGRRFVMKPDEKTGERRRVEESRPGSANAAETDAFQSGKKKILVFSEAGGTGRSYHADNTSGSKNARRAHYLVQGGWRADKAVQGFGRTHRTNQASAPIVSLVTTDLQGQKRFISSIARRLSQLGALTKGQRQAGDQGIFSARDNLESVEASQALRQFFVDLNRNAVEGISLKEFEEQTGLQLRKQDEEGRSSGMREDLPPITQFLNRLLSLKIDAQNAVFQAFSDRMDAVIEARSQAGLLDAGLETVKADKINKDLERTVHTVAESGAETKYVKLQLADRFEPIEFKTVASSTARPVKFWLKSERGKVYAASEAPSLTNGDGRIVDQYRIVNPVSGSRIVGQHLIDAYNTKWTKIDQAAAKPLWQAEIENAPEFVTRDMHLITGAILPIWDRLKGSTRVVRLQTDSGERLIGRVVPKSSLVQTLKNLGAEGEAQKTTPDNLYKHLIGGGRAKLANGWSLSRRVVAGEQRIELKGPSSFSESGEVERDGVFSERINYERRYFVPANEEAGTRVLEKLTQYRPVAEMSDGRAQASTEEGEGGEDFSAVPKGWESADGFTAPSMSEAEIDQVRDIVDRVAGVDPAFAATIPIPKESWGARQWGKTEDGNAQGYYSARKDEIVIALDYGSPRAGFHEAFHRLQHRFLNDREMQILERESEKLRGVLRKDMVRKSQADKMSQSEVEAETFAIYATNRDLPINNIIKRAWNRMLRHLQRLRNAMNGLGYQTSEDIFERARTGEINRRGERSASSDRGASFSAEKGADGKDQLIIPGAERMSDREIARRKALAAKQAKKPQKGTEGLPLFGDSKDQGEMFSARSPDEQAVLDRIVPSEDKKSWWRRQSFSSLYTAIKDDLDPLRRLRNELTDGAAVPAKKDFYVLARLTRGSHGKAQQFLENGTFDFNTLRNTGKSLKAVLAPVKKDLDGLRAYAVSKRTLELDARGIQTGVPVPEAQATVTAGAAKYQAVFEDLVAYQRSLTEYLHASGILSDDGYAAMLTANKDYVPFFRMMGEETELGHGLGSGLKTRNPVKGIRGSERQIIDPIESIIKNTFLFVSLAERNRAVSAIDDLAQASPRGDELVTKEKPGVHPTVVTEQEIARFLKSQGVDPAAASAMTIFRPNTFRPAPNEIAFFRDGKRQIRTVSAEVGEAVNALDRESINLLTRILSAPARTLRAGAVLSPDFIARNPVRDQFSAFAFSSNGYVPVYDLVRGLASLFTRGEGYQAWLKSGGASASQVSIDRDYINQKVIQLESPSAMSRIKNVVKSPIEALRILSELTENATRIGEYMRARAKGKDEFEAGYDAREVTLDFARFGAQTRAVNAIIPFWNASVEGNDRAVRAFAKRPLATTLKVAASITLPSILLWWANHDDDRWKELPQWQRDIFWIVLTDKWEPHQVEGDNGGLRDATDEDVGNKAKRTYMRKRDGKWEVNNGTVWKIPKPFELGILFGSVPERALDAYFTDRPDAFKNLHKTVLGAFLPNVIPQAALPMLEHATNHSFFLDRQIVPKYLQDVRPKYQSTPFTTETAKKIGALISKFNDGTSFSSPIVIENYVRQWTGSIGMDTLGLIDQGLKAAGMSPVKVQPAKTLNDMPVIRAFVARFPGSGQSIEDFYDEFQKRKVNSATVKYLSKTGESETASEEAGSHALQTADKIQKALGVQSKVIRGIYLNKEMTPEEKRTLINNTYLQMIELARSGNEILRGSARR